MTDVVTRLVNETNAHNIDGIVGCFADNYVLEAPLHPSRSFEGNEQVRRNWTQILASVPDIRVQVLQHAGDNMQLWTEWEMAGTRGDGGKFHMRGVFIFTISDALIRRARMYLEPVDDGTARMDEALRGQLERGAR